MTVAEQLGRVDDGDHGFLTVSLVIPAMNEAGNIGAVLRRVPEYIDEVVLVDGNSSDGTVAVARAVRPDVVVVAQEPRGKGAALRAGFAAATCDVIVMVDADGSMDPHEIRRYLSPIFGGYQLVKGSRFMAGGSSRDITPWRSLGNRALLVLVNRLFNAHFTDLCYGYIAFRRSCLRDLDLDADGFEIETQIVVNAVRCRLWVTEVASLESARLNGTSHLRPVRDGGRVLRTVLRSRLASRPKLDVAGAPAASVSL